MNKPTRLVLLFVVFHAGCFGASGAQCPNIVYVLADDLGYGDLSGYNPESKIETPHLDQLAREGVCFTDAHAPSALCTPTRYGILTGRYSWRTSLKFGVLGGYSGPLIAPGRHTVASLLKGEGYRTAVIGKWHLGMDLPATDGGPIDDLREARYGGVPSNIDWHGSIRNGPLARGFDYFFGCSASWDMPPYAWIENNRFVDPNMEPAERSDGFGRPGVKSLGMKPEDALLTLAERAVKYIETSGTTYRESPFFLYLPLTAPHTPIAPRKEFLGRSGAGKYGDFVVEVDWVVGEIVAALEKSGLTGETLVIFTSDNGPDMVDQNLDGFGHSSPGPFLGRKRDNWEGGHRVPFIARWPGTIPAGVVSREPVCLTDLAATAVALAGGRMPPDAAEDSCNILPALLDPESARTLREAIVHQSGQGEFGIRQGRWKLMLHPGSGGTNYRTNPAYAAYYAQPIQLYDLESDPGESTNLARAHPEIVARLTALLERYVVQGRSTPGAPQDNDTPNDWRQLHWMNEKVQASRARSKS